MKPFFSLAASRRFGIPATSADEKNWLCRQLPQLEKSENDYCYYKEGQQWAWTSERAKDRPTEAGQVPAGHLNNATGAERFAASACYCRKLWSWRYCCHTSACPCGGTGNDEGICRVGSVDIRAHSGVCDNVPLRFALVIAARTERGKGGETERGHNHCPQRSFSSLQWLSGSVPYCAVCMC